MVFARQPVALTGWRWFSNYAVAIPPGEKRCVAPFTWPSAQPRTLVFGQLVLFLTDGVAETTSPQGVTFGIERALDVVRAQRHRPAGEIVERLYGCARGFAQDSAQQDDATAVILKIQAQTQSSGLDGAGI